MNEDTAATIAGVFFSLIIIGCFISLLVSATWWAVVKINNSRKRGSKHGK